MFNQYKTLCDFRQRPKVLSEYIFRQIFNTEFNLAFKRPKKDTCCTCTEIKIAENSAVISDEMKSTLVTRKDVHMSLVESTNKSFNDDVPLSQILAIYTYVRLE